MISLLEPFGDYSWKFMSLSRISHYSLVPEEFQLKHARIERSDGFQKQIPVIEEE